MPLGFKARALNSIKSKALPSLWWNSQTTVNLEQIQLVISMHKFWAIRTDAPEKPEYPILLPLWGSNRGTNPVEAPALVEAARRVNPALTFILSEAPDDSTRYANVVAQVVDDVLYGEVGFQPMTLRDAWVKGKLYQFSIDGTVGDFLRNERLGERCIRHLREIRKLIDSYHYQYEISITQEGRLMFWQELPMFPIDSYCNWVCKNI